MKLQAAANPIIVRLNFGAVALAWQTAGEIQWQCHPGSNRDFTGLTRNMSVRVAKCIMRGAT